MGRAMREQRGLRAPGTDRTAVPGQSSRVFRAPSARDPAQSAALRGLTISGLATVVACRTRGGLARAYGVAMRGDVRERRLQPGPLTERGEDSAYLRLPHDRKTQSP